MTGVVCEVGILRSDVCHACGGRCLPITAYSQAVFASHGRVCGLESCLLSWNNLLRLVENTLGIQLLLRIVHSLVMVIAITVGYDPKMSHLLSLVLIISRHKPCIDLVLYNINKYILKYHVLSSNLFWTILYLSSLFMGYPAVNKPPV